MAPRLSRRRFLGSSAAATAALPLTPRGSLRGRTELRVLSIGVVGTIGAKDRAQIARHPDTRIVGLCDVDARALETAGKDHPDAFRCRDYREAFERYVDRFDAVIVSTPDHTHAPIMLTALAHDKHVYGQKPLVHQLAELSMLDEAMKAKPALVTQLGNQRMVYPGRRAAVDILRSGRLGRAVEAHVWTSAPNPGRYFNFERELLEPTEPPDHLDWDLWLGPCAEAPYRRRLAPIVWRSWWDYGTNGLGDWGCHVLDVILFAYDALQSPISVLTHAPEVAGPHFHVTPCRSTITYDTADAGDVFAKPRFAIHYSDRGQRTSRAALGLPPDAWMDGNCTVVVCEDGVLVLGAGGRLEIWRDGQRTPGLEIGGLPEYTSIDHWHAWVEHCLGRGERVELRTPFRDAVRITEPALLAVKATRFPGQELFWDRGLATFTNSPEATASIVRRDYREGFAPPRV